MDAHQIDDEGNGHFCAEDLAPDLRHLIEPISAEAEAWLLSQVDVVQKLADDEEPPNAPTAPLGAPIVFLDLDDVICLCDPVGALDALACVTAKRVDADWVYQRLFHLPAVEVLRQMHDQMRGRLRYVISSTWREYFTRAQLRYVMRRAGLGFVADSIEDRARWATPPFHAPDRLQEISTWLARHHDGEPYVVIDDWWSGTSLLTMQDFEQRVVLCDVGDGLQERHLPRLVNALRTA